MRGQILVIDDNPMDIQVATALIEGLGFGCIGFTEPKQALTWMEGHTPNLIFLDISMPGTSGFDLISVLRQSEQGRNVPIVMLSGKNQPDDVREAIKRGANDFVIKSPDPVLLREKVARTLAKNEVDLPAVGFDRADGISAEIVQSVRIVAMSEFGVKVISNRKLQTGENLTVKGVPMDIFGRDRVTLRCLSSEAQAAPETFISQMAFIGMTDAQRLAIRKYCRAPRTLVTST